MFCGKCGQSNMASERFCINCGSELRKVAAPASDTGPDTSRLKQKFPGLTSKMYEHPDDTKSLKVMQSIPLMGDIIKQVFKHWHNLNYEVILTANSVKVTQRHFPDTYELFEECAQILDLERLPKFYITQEPRVHAYTTGTEDTFLVLSSGLIDLMTSEEQSFIIGHEMGHIKSNHVLYHDVANWIKNLATAVGSVTLGMGEVIGMGLMTALMSWIKKSEFTADRAGLLACQDIDVATKALIKMALGSKKLFSQISIEEYLRQGEELEDDEDKSPTFKAIRMMQNAVVTHPFITTRVRDLQEWSDSDHYKKILDTDYQVPETPQEEEDEEIAECPVCRARIDKDDISCEFCGHTLYKAPPICPECFRDLKPSWTTCPHCKKNLYPSKAKIWLQDKYKNVRSFLGDNISNFKKNRSKNTRDDDI